MNTQESTQPSIRIAMIMAAGYGTRMGELTRDIPKPLLPLGDFRIIELVLKKFANQGIERAVINLHHFADVMKEHIGNGQRYGLEVIYSEEQAILGSGGGIANAEIHFEGETILVANADVLCDLDIRDFYRYHCDNRALATMNLLPSRNTHDYTLVKYQADCRLLSFLDKDATLAREDLTGIFTGHQILSPEARAYLKPQYQSVINRFYKQALAENKRLMIHPFDGEWIDVGTAEFYYDFLKQIHNGEVDIQRFL
jgi:NDP-sugar pyrophosphorylase family protein